MKLSGKVWKVGSNIRATHLVSGKYDKQAMSKQYDECAKHILEDVDPGIAPNVKKGDILIAGEGFGTGHAHYYQGAVMGSKHAGFSAFLTEGINGLFQRAAIDFGLMAWVIPGIAAFADTGDDVEIDLGMGIANNITQGTSLKFEPVSQVVLDIITAGGSQPWALKRVGAEHAIA